MPAPVPERPAVPRRAVLGTATAIVAAAVVTGCSSDGGTPSTRRSPGPAARTVSADVAVAITAVGRIGQVTDLLARTLHRHPGLRGSLGGLSAVHAAHLRLLQDAVPPKHRNSPAGSPPTQPVPRRRPAALHAVVAAEHSLRPQLEGLAVRADSGEFARLLAAMSAAVGQQLAGLPS